MIIFNNLHLPFLWYYLYFFPRASFELGATIHVGQVLHTSANIVPNTGFEMEGTVSYVPWQRFFSAHKHPSGQLPLITFRLVSAGGFAGCFSAEWRCSFAKLKVVKSRKQVTNSARGNFTVIFYYSLLAFLRYEG